MEAELRAAEWYYSDGDSNEGPHSVTDMSRLFSNGTISEATYVWREAEPPLDWLPLTDPAHVVLLKMLRAAPRAAASVMSALTDAPPPTLASRTSGSYNNVWSKDFKTKDRSGSASGGSWKTGNAAEVAAANSDDPPPLSQAEKEARRAAARAMIPTDAAGIAALEDAFRAKAAMEDDAPPLWKTSDLTKSGEDRFLIDVKTGEQVFIEAGTDRKYRLGEGGKKLYEDLKPKKTYGGGGGSWQTSQVNASANRGAVPAGQGGFRRV